MISDKDDIKNYKISSLILERTEFTKIINKISDKNLQKIFINEKDEEQKNLFKIQLLEEDNKLQDVFIFREKMLNDLYKNILNIINIFKSYT
jgi:hypothetical protein